MGLGLREAWYHCLYGETDGSDFEDRNFYFGGEVRLEFGAGATIYVSWEENAGWENPFSLVVSGVTVFKPNSLMPWPVSHLKPWSLAIGKSLIGACVYGAGKTPYIVCLSFDADVNIYVGTGWEHEFRDGDDVLVRSSEAMIDLDDWNLLWSGQA